METSLEQAHEPEESSGCEDEQVSVDELRTMLKQQEKEAAEYLDRLQRLQAEFENYKKRVEREKEEIRCHASEDLLLSVVEAVENLEKALDSDGSEESLRQGVRGVLRMLQKSLREEDVRPIEAIGEPFDPSVHMAVMTTPSDEHPEDTVVEELQRGYMVGDRVLRPAMVQVSRNE